MTQTYFPYDTGAGSSVKEDQWREMAQFWMESGVLFGHENDLQVYGDSSGYQVKLKTGRAWIKGNYYKTDAEVVIPIGLAADATNPRIDTVVLRNDFVNDLILPAVIHGTPAGSPVAPTLTDNSSMKEFPLANVAIAANATGITSANVTDRRTYVTSVSVRHNLLVNSCFDLWQRGVGPFTTSVFGPDKWKLNLQGTDTLSVSQETVLVDVGARYSAKHVFVLGTGAGVTNITQIYDNAQGTRIPYDLAGLPISVSVRVKLATAVANAVRLELQDGVNSLFSSFAAATTDWQTLTLTLPAVTTSPTELLLSVLFAASVTAYITKAMMVVGSTPLPFVPPIVADEWARCLRYYEKIATGGVGNEPFGIAHCVSTTAATLPWRFKVRKAVTPTVTISNPGDINTSNAPGTSPAPWNGTAPTVFSTSQDVTQVSGTSLSALLVAGNAGYTYANTGTGQITAEANP